MSQIIEELPASRRRTAFETVLMGGGFVLFLVMLYEMHEPGETGTFINPPLIALAAALLVWPIRRLMPVRALLLSGGLLLLLWFMTQLAGILVPFVAVYLLAYLLEPAISWLNKRYNVPRWLSSLGVVLLVLGGLTLLLLLVIPSLLGEIQSLGTRLINVIGRARDWAIHSTLLDRLAETGLADKDELITQITTGMQAMVTSLTGSLPALVQGVVSSISTVLGVITLLAVLPVVLYYLLKDYPFITRRVLELFPTFDGQREYLLRAGGIVGSYLRGQLIIGGIAAFNVSVLLTIFAFPFAILLGIVTGLLNLIPNIGALLTMILGIAVALVFGDPVAKDLILVVAVLLGQSLLEQSILGPTILSNQVGLHPILIILSLFVFGYFMGIFGLFIAVPMTALLMTLYKAYREKITLELSNFSESTSNALGPLVTTTTLHPAHSGNVSPLQSDEIPTEPVIEPREDSAEEQSGT